MIDLLTATDHADPYVWSAVALAHVAIGLALVGAVAAALGWFAPRVPGAGRAALGLCVAAYVCGWELGVQRLGAGMADALLDTAMIAAGGVIGLLAWRRSGLRVALVLLAVAAVIAIRLLRTV